MEQQPPDQPEERMTDALHIELGIDLAKLEGRDIDDATARRIASLLHGGQDSALYSLASAGAIDEERLQAELGAVEADENIDPPARAWVGLLGAYAINRPDKGPVEGWHLTTEDEPAHSEQESMEKPKVWIGCLGAYNNGALHGEWIDATKDVEEMREAVRGMLETSPIENAEDYFVADSEGFYSVRLYEYQNLDKISRLGKGIQQHGEAFAQWVGLKGMDYIVYAEQTFEEAYIGKFEDDRSAINDMFESAGVFEALEAAREQVPEQYRDFMIVDTDMFAEVQPECHIVPGSDGSVFAFRAI
jgi:antirestriction protein